MPKSLKSALITLGVAALAITGYVTYREATTPTPAAQQAEEATEEINQALEEFRELTGSN